MWLPRIRTETRTDESGVEGSPPRPSPSPPAKGRESRRQSCGAVGVWKRIAVAPRIGPVFALECT